MLAHGSPGAGLSADVAEEIDLREVGYAETVETDEADESGAESPHWRIHWGRRG